MTSREERLRAAWCQVLHVKSDELDGDSHFFRVGGDSAETIHLITVAEDYKITLNNATIYRFPILSSMAFNSQDIEMLPDAIAPEAVTQILEIDLIQECAKTCRVEEDGIEDIFPAIEL